MDDVRIGLTEANNGVMLWLHDATTDHVLQFNSIDGIDSSKLSPKDHQVLAKLTNNAGKIWTHKDGEGIPEENLDKPPSTYKVAGFGSVTVTGAYMTDPDRNYMPGIQNAKIHLPRMPEDRYLHIQDFNNESPEFGQEYHYTRKDITKQVLLHEPSAPAKKGQFEVRISKKMEDGYAYITAEIRDNATGKKFSAHERGNFIDHDQAPEKAKVYMDFKSNLDAGHFQLRSDLGNPDDTDRHLDPQNVPKGMDPENCSCVGVQHHLPGLGYVMIYDYEGPEIGDQSKRMTGQGVKLQVNGMKPGDYINIPDSHHGQYHKLSMGDGQAQKTAKQRE